MVLTIGFDSYYFMFIIKRAVGRLTGEINEDGSPTVRLLLASRTDKGVHAMGQVTQSTMCMPNKCYYMQMFFLTCLHEGGSDSHQEPVGREPARVQAKAERLLTR